MVRQLARNLWLVPGSPVTLLIRTERSLLVVDPGMGSNRASMILRALEAIGWRGGFQVLLSHAHLDHIEALPELATNTIYIRAEEGSLLINSLLREVSSYGFTPLPQLLKLKPIEIDPKRIRVFDTARGIDGLQLIDLSGHSPGLTGILIEDTVFVADALFGDKLLRRVGVPYHMDVYRARARLEQLSKLADEGFRAVLSHGPVAKDKRFRQLVELNMDRIDRVIQLVQEILSSGCLTMEELALSILKTLGASIGTAALYLAIPTISSVVRKLVEEELITTRVSSRGIELCYSKK